MLYVGGGVLAVLLLSLVADIFRDRRTQAGREAEAARSAEPFDPMAGGYPGAAAARADAAAGAAPAPAPGSGS